MGNAADSFTEMDIINGGEPTQLFTQPRQGFKFEALPLVSGCGLQFIQDLFLLTLM